MAKSLRTVSGRFIPFLLLRTPSNITLASIIFLETFKTFKFYFTIINKYWMVRFLTLLNTFFR